MAGESFLNITASGERLKLAAAGEWTARNAEELERQISKIEDDCSRFRRMDVDLAQVKKLDTFGAWLLERMSRACKLRDCDLQVTGASDTFRQLIDEVRSVNTKEDPVEQPPTRLEATLSSIGQAVFEIWHTVLANMHLMGAVAVAAGRVFARPSTFRITSLVHHLDYVCWRAVPIILLITFLIGCIIAQQGIFHFRKFGADIFVVDMVGILVLREIGVLIVAIMVAGRSGSAFTAEIGSMKMREEIDALRTMGFDPVEVLILPRFLALVIALPILAFLGSMAALYGGGLVAWLYGGIDPEIFLSRLKEAITIEHFQVGMIKAPFMAAIIGIVACVNGLEVRGSAESLGLRTTNSVVESIFLVIVLDGLFAIFFASIGM